MKRKGDLYDKIISMDNLRQADVMARKGKKHQPGVQAMNLDREANLIKLHEMLRDQTYRTSTYTIFPINV
jgi:RNA-directed DNA polymerase